MTLPRIHRPMARPLAVLLLASTFALSSCASDSAPAASTDGGNSADASGLPDDDAGGVVAAPGDEQVEVTVQPSAEQQVFAKALKSVIDTAQTMTVDELNAAYKVDQPAAPLNVGDPMTAKYMSLIDPALALTQAEKDHISKEGFAVLDRQRFPTFAEAALKVYELDLPILVTSDMILHALHASYDEILKTLEKGVLIDAVGTMLADMHGAVPQVDTKGDALAKDALADVDLYLTVARSLLADAPVASVGGPAVDDKASALLDLVAAEQMAGTEIFGAPRKMDFSQFKPRGHYEGDPELERYFRAMMWLGRVDLRLMEFDALAGEWIFRKRQLAAALVMHGAMQAANARDMWHQADDLIGMMVGPVDYLDMLSLDRVLDDMGWTGPADVALASTDALEDLAGRLVAGVYGSQQIASHYLETDPYSSEPTPLAPSFALLGQRFTVDSHVFSNVVYDRVIHNGQKVQRVLPNPIDAMFVLGNDQALPLLADDLKAHPYQGALHVMRHLVDSYDEAFWAGNVYNLWLDSLRAMNEPTTAAPYPKAMWTAAWRDKTLHTQLSSWAQLRHDTLLYAKQSYTGGVACEHPDGYVEPRVALWRKLGELADVAGHTLSNADVGSATTKQQLGEFFANFGTTMGTLEAISERELAGEDLTADDIAFLKATIHADPGCGDPVFSGWYAKLYWWGAEPDDFKPTIADVHTNPNQGPLPGPNVLHVATSDVNLMVFAADDCDGGMEAFVGPVFRYHEVDVPEIKRLSDRDWEEMLEKGQAPGQPAWTSSFVVP